MKAASDRQDGDIAALQKTTVVRLVDGRLAWYPPGASEEPRWLDDDGARDSLRAALAQRKVGVCFAVPGEDVRLLTLEVSAAERKHIAASLPFTLEEQVAEDIDDLHFSSCTLDRETLGVAICSREKMDEWQALLAEFPGILRWCPEPLLLPWQPGEWCLVLEEQEAIVRVGRCDGFTIERGLVGPMLTAAALAGEPESIVVYGADQQSDTALLPENLRERVQWRQGNLYAALLLGETGAVDLNLRQGDYAPRLPLGRWWKQWRAVAAVFAVGFCVQLAALYMEYRNLSNENLALRSAVQDSYRRAFPRGNAPEPEKQMRRQLDALRGTGQSSGFVSLVNRVGGVVATMPGTTISTMNYNEKGDEMRMNIVAGDFEGVERLRSRINEAGLDAVMENSSAQGDKVRARLRVSERS